MPRENGQPGGLVYWNWTVSRFSRCLTSHLGEGSSSLSELVVESLLTSDRLDSLRSDEMDCQREKTDLEVLRDTRIIATPPTITLFFPLVYQVSRLKRGTS